MIHGQITFLGFGGHTPSSLAQAIPATLTTPSNPVAGNGGLLTLAVA